MQSLKALFYKAYFTVALLFDENLPKDDEYIDDVSVGLAVAVIGFARGFVYQKEQTKKEREEKEELKHQIEMFKIKNKN